MKAATIDHRLTARIVAGLAIVALIVHLLTIHRYGYFRDELYYIACARHLDFGYVDLATILEQSEDAELITEAMDELPAEFREILALRHQEDLSYKEIADIAQIPPGTVMSGLARARLGCFRH
jgi:RNA polymerase sigma factor (sigma-70 family)